MNRLVVVALVKNEMGRFWPSALAAWQEFADRIVVLDDGSSDGTKELANTLGLEVYERGAGVSAWGAEAPARAELWQIALSESEQGDYILVLDGDMVPARNPKPLMAAEPDGVAFPLFDLWEERDGELFYRDDGFWQAHRYPRVWMVRRPEKEPGQGWLWPAKGIHTGHFPSNLHLDRILYTPADHGLLHYSYILPEMREAKLNAYNSVKEQLNTIEMQHAASITDAKPSLRKLPFTPEYRLETAE